MLVIHLCIVAFLLLMEDVSNAFFRPIRFSKRSNKFQGSLDTSGPVTFRRIRIHPSVNTTSNHSHVKPSKARQQKIVNDTTTAQSYNIDNSVIDLSQFALGQELKTIAVHSNNSGVIVQDTVSLLKAFLPRSELTLYQFRQLSSMIRKQSSQPVIVEVKEVDTETASVAVTLSAVDPLYLSVKKVANNNSSSLVANKTITRWASKYSPVTKKHDFASLANMTNTIGEVLNATLISKHNFGWFARCDKFNMDGLIPIFRIPKSIDSASIKEGDTIVVKVDEVNAVGEKLVFSLATKSFHKPSWSNNTLAASKTPPKTILPMSFPLTSETEIELQRLQALPKDSFIPIHVLSVSNLGMSIRPHGYKTLAGLLLKSQIPFSLQTILRKRLEDELSIEIAQEYLEKQSKDTRTNDTQHQIMAEEHKKYCEKLKFEHFFAVGDIMKARVHSVTIANSTYRVEMSMLPARDEDDGFLPEYQQQEYFFDKPSFDMENDHSAKPRRSELDPQGGDEDIFDPESLMIWWQGEKYHPFHMLLHERQMKMGVNAENYETEIWRESQELITGEWRSRFEEDLRRDSLDVSSRERLNEQKEITDAIGDLALLTEEMQLDPLRVGLLTNHTRDASYLASKERGALQEPPEVPEESFKMFTRDDLLDILPESWVKNMTFSAYEERERQDALIQTVLRKGKKGDLEELEEILSEIELEMKITEDRHNNN